jgi:copper chaperone CopZ
VRYISLMGKKQGAEGQRLGVFDVNGATCPSCAFTIERAGRRVPGVSDIRVDVTTHEIRVSYDGTPAALDGVKDIVRRLGYLATLRSDGLPGG